MREDVWSNHFVEVILEERVAELKGEGREEGEMMVGGLNR